jgi:hypothetical protein
VAPASAKLGAGEERVVAVEDEVDAIETTATGFGLGLRAHNLLYRRLRWSQAASRPMSDACRWDQSAISSAISGD